MRTRRTSLDFAASSAAAALGVVVCCLTIVPSAVAQNADETQVENIPGRSFTLRDVSEHWGSDVTTPLPWIIVAGGLLLIALGVVLLVRWWRQRHLRSRPWAVFHAVASTAGLTLLDRWLLMRIAHQQRLPTPLTLLLSGRTLRLHARAYVEHLPPFRRAPVMQRIASIRRDVFGHMGAEADLIEPNAPRSPAAV